MKSANTQKLQNKIEKLESQIEKKDQRIQELNQRSQRLLRKLNVVTELNFVHGANYKMMGTLIRMIDDTDVEDEFNKERPLREWDRLVTAYASLH